MTLTIPKDREVWIITDEGDAHQVWWCDQTKFWTGRDEWLRTDGESGGWEASEIVGWGDSEAQARACGMLAASADLAAGLASLGMDPKEAADYAVSKSVA